MNTTNDIIKKYIDKNINGTKALIDEDIILEHIIDFYLIYGIKVHDFIDTFITYLNESALLNIKNKYNKERIIGFFNESELIFSNLRKENTNKGFILFFNKTKIFAYNNEKNYLSYNLDFICLFLSIANSNNSLLLLYFKIKFIENYNIKIDTITYF